MKASDENKNGEKGEMLSYNKHFFFALNITNRPLKGKIKWTNKDYTEVLSVDGLEPGHISEKMAFSPSSGHRDIWSFDKKGSKYQLNVYGDDVYTVIVISDYGLGILPTATSPDTWKW
jgi:hypothetical protein